MKNILYGNSEIGDDDDVLESLGESLGEAMREKAEERAERKRKL